MKTTFVIGDVHGCVGAFERLLKRIDFDPKRHRLWLAGDIVNRGPDSLGMLRRAIKLEKKMGSRFRMVLGNHDLHLLGVEAGTRQRRPKDTLDEILAAPDKGKLMAWLRSRQLAHAAGGVLLVHAGLLPQWTPHDAMSAARRLEKRLRSKRGKRFFETRWSSRSLATLTRVRMLDARHRMASYSGSPESAPPKITPWYEPWVANRTKKEEPITTIFGHWAALGQRKGGKGTRKWISLDSGCVYGRTLTALRINDFKIFTVSAEKD